MKNYRTPRTLAECEFTMGYPISVPHERPSFLRALLSWLVGPFRHH